MPETRDRTLEEINEMFEAKIPARKFKKYVCTGTEAMANEALKKDSIHLEGESKDAADENEPTTKSEQA